MLRLIEALAYQSVCYKQKGVLIFGWRQEIEDLAGRADLADYNFERISGIISKIFWNDESWQNTPKRADALLFLISMGDEAAEALAEADVMRDPTCADYRGICPITKNEPLMLQLIRSAPVKVVQSIVYRHGFADKRGQLEAAVERFGEFDGLDVDILDLAFRVTANPSLNPTMFRNMQGEGAHAELVLLVKRAKPIIQEWLANHPDA